MVRAFSPKLSSTKTQPFGLGWYGAAPLALRKQNPWFCTTFNYAWNRIPARNALALEANGGKVALQVEGGVLVSTPSLRRTSHAEDGSLASLITGPNK